MFRWNPRLMKAGVAVAAFAAVVIGSGGREDNPQRWGWYEFTSGTYRAISLRERQRRLRLTSDAGTEVWAADRCGCRRVANP